MKPEDLLFAGTHEWAYVSDKDGAKIASVGISAFALEQLTDLVFMELPEIGTTVTAGQEFGEVESVKAVSPIYCPVTGEVIEVNVMLPERLETLSQSPYEDGWIARIRITDESCLSALMDYETYQKQCAAEG